MKHTILLLALGLSVGGWIWGWAKDPAVEPNRVGDFMQLKLTHAQKVLEGLATEDFDAIAKHAQNLSLLSQESNWKVLQTAEYLEHSVDFRKTADAMGAAAKKENLDGAALAYVDMTMKCLNCHKYVRGVRTASAR